MSKTSEILKDMLKENTGTHFLDSGGHYGRHWQQNQGVDFEQQEESTLTVEHGIEVTHDVYHWLLDKVEYDEETTDQFCEFAQLEGNEDKCWFELMQDFPEYFSEVNGLDIGGFYGEGSPVVVNTYNGEDALSQVLQYVYFTADHEEYVVLQIHGGCDVRGGYTAPKVFKCSEEHSIFDNARGSIVCENDHEHYWATDDSYNFCFEGNFVGEKLNDYDVLELDEGEDWKEGKLCYRDKEVYCPLCGGKLRSHWV